MIEDIADDYLYVSTEMGCFNNLFQYIELEMLFKMTFKQWKQKVLMFLFDFLLKDLNSHHSVWQVAHYRIS